MNRRTASPQGTPVLRKITYSCPNLQKIDIIYRKIIGAADVTGAWPIRRLVGGRSWLLAREI